PEEGEHLAPLARRTPGPEAKPAVERRTAARRHEAHGPRFFALSPRLTVLVTLVAVLGMAAGAFALLTGGSHDVLGLIAIVALVGLGQALALEVDTGSISLSAVGALA